MPSSKITVLLICGLFCVKIKAAIPSLSSQLFSHLSNSLNNYSNVTLPSRRNEDEPIEVKLQIQLIQILEVVSSSNVEQDFKLFLHCILGINFQNVFQNS